MNSGPPVPPASPAVSISTPTAESIASPLNSPSFRPIAHALRAASAGCLCLLLAEWLQFEHTNLAVWTTHMVMAKYNFTIFQRGLERIAGRAMGIGLGWILASCFLDVWLVRDVLASIILLVCFYIYFADRLAYTFLNAGLYTVVMLSVGEREPDLLIATGISLFGAIVLGVACADGVVWLTRAEADLHVQAGTTPLLPIQRNWLNRAGMLVVGTWIVFAWTRIQDASTDNATISLMMVAIVPDLHAALWKGELRLLGALAAGIWAALMFIVVSLVPHLVVMTALLFLGLFLAMYVARAGGKFDYLGVQMGLVLPLIAIVPPDAFGDLNAFYERIEGIVIAMATMLCLASLWPTFPKSNTH